MKEPPLDELDFWIIDALNRLGRALRRDGNALNINTLTTLGDLAEEFASMIERDGL